MRQTTTYVLSPVVMSQIRQPEDVEYYIKRTLTRNMGELLFNYHKHDVTAARHLDTFGIEYKLSLHVFTQQMLDEYIQFRIKEALNNAKR
jgi:hypothetical protein